MKFDYRPSRVRPNASLSEPTYMLVTTVSTAGVPASLWRCGAYDTACRSVDGGRIRFTDQPNPEEWTSQRRLSPTSSLDDN